MKKNLFFKLGLFCATLVLVATCFITNAWAKYTKTVTATDTARVAKFEVAVKNGDTEITENTTIDIFTTQLEHIKQDANGKNIVSDKLIAPDSHGKFEVVVENKSEVSVTLKLTGTIAYEGLPGDVTSVPVKFYVGTTAPTDDSAYKALDAVTIADEVIDVNGTNQTKTYTVYWKWISENDANDTILGEAENVKVTVNLKLVVEQYIAA